MDANLLRFVFGEGSVPHQAHLSADHTPKRRVPGQAGAFGETIHAGSGQVDDIVQRVNLTLVQDLGAGEHRALALSTAKARYQCSGRESGEKRRGDTPLKQLLEAVCHPYAVGVTQEERIGRLMKAKLSDSVQPNRSAASLVGQSNPAGRANLQQGQQNDQRGPAGGSARANDGPQRGGTVEAA